MTYTNHVYATTGLGSEISGTIVCPWISDGSYSSWMKINDEISYNCTVLNGESSFNLFEGVPYNNPLEMFFYINTDDPINRIVPGTRAARVSGDYAYNNSTGSILGIEFTDFSTYQDVPICTMVRKNSMGQVDIFILICRDLIREKQVNIQRSVDGIQWENVTDYRQWRWMNNEYAFVDQEISEFISGNRYYWRVGYDINNDTLFEYGEMASLVY